RPLQGGAFRPVRAGSCAWGVPGWWSRGGSSLAFDAGDAACEQASQLPVEPAPVQVELAPELADPALAQPVPGGQLPRRVVQRDGLGDPAVAVSQPGQPDGVIDPEGGLLVGRGDRVVAQPLLESVPGVLAVRVAEQAVVALADGLGQRLDPEAVQTPGDRAHG